MVSNRAHMLNGNSVVTARMPQVLKHLLIG